MNGNEPIGCGLGAGRASGDRLQVSCKCELRDLCMNSDLQEEEKVPFVIRVDAMGGSCNGPRSASCRSASIWLLTYDFFLSTMDRSCTPAVLMFR